MGNREWEIGDRRSGEGKGSRGWGMEKTERGTGNGE